MAANVKQKRLYVGGLAGNGITEEDITSRFSTFGSIKQCWFKNLHRGFAFIEFNNHNDALKALNAKHVLHIKGLKVTNLNWAKPQVEASSNTRKKEINLASMSCHEYDTGHNGQNEQNRFKANNNKRLIETETVKICYPKHWPVMENSTWKKYLSKVWV